MKHCPICQTNYPSQYRTCPQDAIVLIEVKELEPGSVFHGVYRIVRQVGRGGMGIVYLAEHILLRQPRALKFLSGELIANPDAASRMLREAQRASEIGLHQPNIVKTLDMGQSEDGSFFLCMEFVDGPSLAKLIEQHPQGMDPHRAIALIREISAGLAAAHAKGMVHRDIKPDNILIATDESGIETPKITDFGIVTGRQEETRLSRTGLQPLTPGYAAPEQWKGLIPSHQLDGRTDLYALGCVFFEMLTGSPVFHGKNAEELREQHIHAAPPFPSLVRPELAKYSGLDAIVVRLLNKSREHRPTDIVTFLAELGEVRLSNEISHFQSAPEGASGREYSTEPANFDPKILSPKLVKRPNAIRPLAALMILTGMVGSTWYLVRERQQKPIVVAQTTPQMASTQPNPSEPHGQISDAENAAHGTDTRKASDIATDTVPKSDAKQNFAPPDVHEWVDSATGFDWAWAPDRIYPHWSDANNFCSRLRLANKSDWKLPTIEELKSVYDPTQNRGCGPGYECHLKPGLKLSGFLTWSRDPGGTTGDVFDPDNKSTKRYMAFAFEDIREVESVPANWDGYRAHAVCLREPTAN